VFLLDLTRRNAIDAKQASRFRVLADSVAKLGKIIDGLHNFATLASSITTKYKSGIDK
jgi:hypothetical protein